MEVRDWQPMNTAPIDGRQIIVLLSNDRECIAEYWEGPPGKEAGWGGWGVCMTQSFCEGTLHKDCNAEMIAWKPFEGPVDVLPPENLHG